MKKKIKKFGGGALSADSESIQSSIDKDSKFFYGQRLNVLLSILVLNPELSVRKMGDDIMDPKQTISR
jgi:hypothetical protein